MNSSNLKSMSDDLKEILGTLEEETVFLISPAGLSTLAEQSGLRATNAVCSE